MGAQTNEPTGCGIYTSDYHRSQRTTWKPKQCVTTKNEHKQEGVSHSVCVYFPRARAVVVSSSPCPPLPKLWTDRALSSCWVVLVKGLGTRDSALPHKACGGWSVPLWERAFHRGARRAVLVLDRDVGQWSLDVGVLRHLHRRTTADLSFAAERLWTPLLGHVIDNAFVLYVSLNCVDKSVVLIQLGLLVLQGPIEANARGCDVVALQAHCCKREERTCLGGADESECPAAQRFLSPRLLFTLKGVPEREI